MFFRKSAKSQQESSSKDVVLPPIPGAQGRDGDAAEVNGENGDGERPMSPERLLSDDENEASGKHTDLVVKAADDEDKKEKPSAYIKPANFDFWVRAMDVNGLIYYYNTKSGESTWLAPCVVCYKNGERFCLKCAVPYCEKHFQKKHKYMANPDEHMWSTQEQQTEREELTDPEHQEYCIECQLKVANRLCLECWDPYCVRCFDLVHHVGNLKTHTVMTYSRAHEGWFTVRRYDGANGTGGTNGANASPSMKMIAQTAHAASAGDGGSFIASGMSQKTVNGEGGQGEQKNASTKPGVLEYYVHGETREVTYEKPVELMNDLEKVLLQNWKLHQRAAEDYVAQIDELQFELEKAKYERDNLMVENAQMAQGIMPVAGGASRKGKSGGATGTAGSGPMTSSKRPETPVLEKLIEGEGDDYRQKLLHPTDRKRGEARANYMKDLLEQPLPAGSKKK
jgi:hypothetical protein